MKIASGPVTNANGVPSPSQPALRQFEVRTPGGEPAAKRGGVLMPEPATGTLFAVLVMNARTGGVRVVAPFYSPADATAWAKSKKLTAYKPVPLEMTDSATWHDQQNAQAELNYPGAVSSEVLKSVLAA